MSILALAPKDAAPADASASATDPAVLRAERRLALLAELAEIGMELARALKPPATGCEGEACQATAADAAPGRRRDPAEAFAGLSRAIRLTVALEAKADEELRDLLSGVARARDEKRARLATDARDAAEQNREEREELIQLLVTEAGEETITSEADRERLDNELEERLLLDVGFWSDPARPLREVVERYCDYFALTPDWSRWRGDHWAPPSPPVWPWAAGADASRAPRPPAPVPRVPALE